MKRFLMSLTMLTAISSFSILQAAALPAPAQPAPLPAAGALIPIVFQSAAGTFDGVLNVTRFAVQNGQLIATGTLTGVVKDALGNVVGAVMQTLSLPVLGTTTATCDILHLELGPLDLDLLGLVVHLDKVVLDIDAQSGPGNLLGNLLCAVAGLLDGTGPLGQLAAVLNNILRALG